jgi:hypothetical protein
VAQFSLLTGRPSYQPRAAHHSLDHQVVTVLMVERPPESVTASDRRPTWVVALSPRAWSSRAPSLPFRFLAAALTPLCHQPPCSPSPATARSFHRCSSRWEATPVHPRHPPFISSPGRWLHHRKTPSSAAIHDCKKLAVADSLRYSSGLTTMLSSSAPVQ